MFSKSFQYGLRSAVMLASMPDEGYVKVQELSAQLGVPQSVMAKTLHTMGAAGVVLTMRGPNGGCRWNPEADHVTLADLVRILDGKSLKGRCLLGFHACGGGACVLPEFSARELFESMGRTTIRQVAEARNPDMASLEADRVQAPG
jgi:Rrf2 family protein